MYLQGHLQKVFDALYEMGVIEPVLNMDWKSSLEEMNKNPQELFSVLQVVNTHQNDVDTLIVQLESFDEKILNYLAMEVAREFADFHSRDEVH